MDSELALKQRISGFVASAHVPPIAPDTIRKKINAAGHGARRRVWIGPAAAAAALVLVVAPLTSRSLVLSMQTRIEELLHWSPPPPAPSVLTASMKPKVVTLSEAKTILRFAFVAPSGLPANAASSNIMVVPTAEYSRSNKTWSRTADVVRFSYKRRDGRTFVIMISRYDPAQASPGTYVFNGDEKDANGLPRRYRRFVWRNGEQVTSASDEGISDAEIAAIRTSMRGTPERTVWPPPAHAHTRMILLQKP